MNEYDSNRISDLFKANGYLESSDSQDISCYILNTCHIREKATEKVYDEIGRIKKLKSAKNDKGQAGELSDSDRDAMARFLLSIAYPPAQRRPYTNEVTKRARDGFELFHVHGDMQPRQNVCGDCHRMPFLVSTNTPGTGMDAPTWRGAYDRWLILPQGRLNIIDFPFYRNLAERGAPERGVWRLSWGGRERLSLIHI